MKPEDDLEEFLRWHARHHSRPRIPIDVLMVVAIFVLMAVTLAFAWR